MAKIGQFDSTNLKTIRKYPISGSFSKWTALNSIFFRLHKAPPALVKFLHAVYKIWHQNNPYDNKCKQQFQVHSPHAITCSYEGPCSEGVINGTAYTRDADELRCQTRSTLV